MIDLSKLDPAVLYEFERQLRAATDDSMYVDIAYDSENNMIVFSAYGTKPEWHKICYGNSDTLTSAVRKCGEDLAAAEEKMEAGNGA